MPTLIIRRGGREQSVVFEGEPTLDEALASNGYSLERPCGGRGVCGQCAVKLSGDISAPNEAERRAGKRLSCQAILRGDCVAELPQVRAMVIETSGECGIGELSPLGEGLGAAVDIGTTTLALRVYDLKTGACIGEAAAANPQRTVAADVMGRIGAAMNGDLEKLRQMIADALYALLREACRALADDVRTWVAAGNTTMLYLFAGRNPQSLSHAPFQADCLFDEWIGRGGARCYLPPCMNAFVGADITCAVLASGMCETPEASLLCDIGTNGEIALWKEGRLYVASTAAGPAFEGAGISCGAASVTGAIDKVWLENGHLAAHTIGGAPAIGLCGSGLIDAAAALLEIGEIDETGAMEASEITIADGVRLLPRDIRALQLAKAAIAAGIQTLMAQAGAAPQDIARFYIAGGFGNHLSISSAVAIGLFPLSLANKAKVIGNAALAGAARVLLSQKDLDESRRITKRSVHVELGGNPDFARRYVEQMLFA